MTIDSSTPLCDASSYGNVECVRLLLRFGALTNPPLNLSTALHEAAMRGKKEGDDVAVIFLLSKVITQVARGLDFTKHQD